MDNSVQILLEQPHVRRYFICRDKIVEGNSGNAVCYTVHTLYRNAIIIELSTTHRLKILCYMVEYITWTNIAAANRAIATQ